MPVGATTNLAALVSVRLNPPSTLRGSSRRAMEVARFWIKRACARATGGARLRKSRAARCWIAEMPSRPLTPADRKGTPARARGRRGLAEQADVSSVDRGRAKRYEIGQNSVTKW